MKKLIRLTEGDLHRIIENAVKRTLNEIGDTEKGQYALGRLTSRNRKKDLENLKYDGNYKLPSFLSTKGYAYDKLPHLTSDSDEDTIEKHIRMNNAFTKGTFDEDDE